MKDIRNVHRIGSNHLSDNNIEELLRKNNRIIYKPTKDQVKYIFNTYGIQIRNNNKGNKGNIKNLPSYKNAMRQIRNVHGIGHNRLSDDEVIGLFRNNNNLKSISTQDIIKYMSYYFGLNINNTNKTTNGGGYKTKKVNKTVSRNISGKKRVIHTGLRGGKYYISNKKKVYI